MPGVLWSPPATAPRATVLLFHGGSGHKRGGRFLRMGSWLASAAGLAVIAIDGPYHGDRVPAPMEPSVYQQLIADEGIDRVTARMTADWLDAVSVPVLYHVQWDDEIFPRAGQFELFGMLASASKQLIARPGPHAQTHPDDEPSWQDFLRRNA